MNLVQKPAVLADLVNTYTNMKHRIIGEKNSIYDLKSFTESNMLSTLKIGNFLAFFFFSLKKAKPGALAGFFVIWWVVVLVWVFFLSVDAKLEHSHSTANPNIDTVLLKLNALKLYFNLQQAHTESHESCTKECQFMRNN